jgi:hypothetical protein
MDFIDELKQLAIRTEQLKGKINTEEATKTSLILPFFQALGYDIFNPMEFTPEYVADVGIKKGEKVDYAILKDEKPTILIEAKWCGTLLEPHDSQLFRYFGTCAAKFAILTNGIIYRFYTDLAEVNKMDLIPFMEFNILNIKDELVPELKKFQKLNFDVEAIFSSASDLKYTNAIKQALTQQLNSPNDAFVNYILSEVYEGKHYQPVIEKFKDITKRAFSQWVNNILNEKFQSAMQTTKKSSTASADETKTDDPIKVENKIKIKTSDLEFEGFAIVKSLLFGAIDLNTINYKDNESYFNVLYKNNNRKWICRMFLDGQKKSIVIPDADNPNGVRYYLDNINDLYNYKDKLIASAKKYTD